MYLIDTITFTLITSRIFFFVKAIWKCRLFSNQIIMDTTKTKKEVRLLGFGTFCSLARNASSGFNPKTRVEINIPVYNRPKFRAGKQFVESVN